MNFHIFYILLMFVLYRTLEHSQLLCLSSSKKLTISLLQIVKPIHTLFLFFNTEKHLMI